MDLTYAGIAMVPLIIGLVELAKRIGLETRWAGPLAVALGLLASLGFYLSQTVPGGEGWAEAVLLGLGLGLSAAGLYSGAKGVKHGEADSN